MALNQGIKSMEDAAKAASSGGGDRMDWFSVDVGDSAILRFIEEGDTWITVGMFASVPTKPKPPNWEHNWPKGMSAVDRLDPQLTLDMITGDPADADKPAYTDCYISENIKDTGKFGDGNLFQSKPRGMVLAVEREGVYEGGRLTAVRDKMVEYEVDGKKHTRPKFVKVNQAYANFFAKFKGFFGHYQTVLDRDYVCERETSKDWNITPLDPVELGEGNPFGVPAGTKLDLRNAEIAKHYEPPETSLDIVLYMASDEYYNRFFVPGQGEPAPGEQQAAQTAAAPDNDPAEDKIRAMAERVKGQSVAKDTEAETPPTPDEVPPTNDAPAEEAKTPAAAGGLKAL